MDLVDFAREDFGNRDCDHLIYVTRLDLCDIIRIMNANKMPRAGARKRHILRWVFLAVLAVVAVAVVLNREWIYDWYRGVSYQPSNEMATIRDKLQLTGRGEFLFNAAQPELNAAEEFNANCRQDEDEVAVLGCYNNGDIFVYNIDAAELNGIRELTTAHELLHVVWARMSEDEKVALVEPLTRTFDANQDFLAEEINQYDISEKQEELYVRAGTEVKNLPEALEKHFAEIFKDQDMIVDFYDSYIVIFRKIKAEMGNLVSEMEELKEAISVKTAEYEEVYSQLEADIVSFNNCAEVAGCFSSEAEFYASRNQLIARQNELNLMNDEINNMVDVYNAKVDVYNADVTESRKLQDMINSNSKVEQIR
jgi:hypothetical protein